MFAVAAVLVALLIAAAVSFGLAYAAAGRGRESLSEAIRHLAALETTAAAADLDAAERAFEDSRRHLRASWTRPLGFVPPFRNNIRAAQAMTDGGVAFVRSGRFAHEAVEVASRTAIAKGRVDLRALGAAEGHARRARDAAVSARRQLASSPQTWLFPWVDNARRNAIERAGEAVSNADQVVSALETAPRMLGARGSKRYFIAFANLAELRGTGGLYGYYATVVVQGGRFRRPAHSGRPQETIPLGTGSRPDAPRWFVDAYGGYRPFATWGNLNLSADFPTIARLARNVLPRELGPIDAIVQIDPIALSAMLELTGPVDVSSWPDPITAENVSAVTQHDAYVELGHDDRVAFLGDVVDGVFDAVLKGDVRPSGEASKALVASIVGGHIQAFATDRRDQSLFEAIGLSREVARDERATDVLGVFTNNSSGNKLDWFLRRRVTYRVAVDPRTNTAHTRLDVTLSNGVPSRGLPDYIVKSPDRSLAEGENRAIVVTVRPRSNLPQGTALDERPIDPAARTEVRYAAYHVIDRIPPRQSSDLAMRSVVPDGLSGEGRHRHYRLRVLRQPTAHPDRYSVAIAVPAGWRTIGTTVFEGPLTSDVVLDVELVHTWRAWLVERAILGPFRLAADLWTLTLSALLFGAYLVFRHFDPFERRSHTALTSADDEGS